jgi:c-di-GMP-binding flagellar brake protein YcgR
MNNAERRRHPRIKIHNLVSYVCLDEDGKPIKTRMATALDISQGGVLLEAPHRIDPGNLILISADDQARIYEAKGKAVYCRDIGGGKYHVGFSFQGQNEECLQFIRCMVRAHYGSRGSA